MSFDTGRVGNNGKRCKKGKIAERVAHALGKLATRAQGRRPSVGLPALPSSGHYALFCQAQPQFQLSWAELALVSISPVARPSARPPVRNSSEIAGKEQNLLPKSCRSTLLELKTITRNVEQMEDVPNGK
jgi:hypothetical protein